MALPSTDPYTSARTPASHTHGNIQNGGTLQTNDITIANGDKLVVTDSSDSSKVARTSVSFDGSTTTKALTPKGTFESFAKSGDITTAIQALDVSSVGGDGKYISAISEADGKISATSTTMDTAPTASSTKAVTSGGIKTALDGKADAVSITGATKCKITYNAQGIVTAGADLAASDIPNLAESKITTKYDKIFNSQSATVSGRYVHICTVRQTGDSYGVATFLMSDRFWNYQHNTTDIITISLADSGGQNTSGNVYVKRVNLSRSETNVKYYYVVKHPATKDISVELWKYSNSGNSTGDLSVKLLNLSRSTNTWGTTIQETEPENAVEVTFGGLISQAINDSDGNAINETYFKSSGDVTLVSGAATKIGTQNGTDVKLTLPTIPGDTKVTQTKDDSGTTAYPLLMAGAADPNGTATTARYDSGVKLTPNTNTISANISGNAATASAAQSGSALETAINGKSPTTHTHTVKINGAEKTIAATGGTAVDLGTYLTSHQDISGKADKVSITGATKCKITYNSQGIVTAGANLAESDIPTLNWSKQWNTTIAFHRDLNRGDSSGDNKKWTKILTKTISNYATASVWGACAVIYDIYNRGYGSPKIPYVGTLELRLVWGHSAGSGYSLKTSGEKTARWIKWNPSYYQTTDPLTYSDRTGTTQVGGIYVKVLAVSDTTVEWWIYNNVWDTGITLVPRYTSDVSPLAYDAANTKMSDELIDYISTTGATVTNHSTGDGSYINASRCSDYPRGFGSYSTSQVNWGTLKESTLYDPVTTWNVSDGAIVFAKDKSTPSGHPNKTLSVQVDGYFYQNEGNYRVLDTSDVTSTYSSTGTSPVNGTAVAAAIGGLDVSSVGGDGKYISAISETDGKISATATTMDTTPTASSTKAVTSGGIKTSLDGKVDIANISLEGQTTTLLSKVQSMGTAGTHYARYYTKTDGGSANISDKPESGSKGFVCEVICKRNNGASDYRYQLICWVQGDNNPYVASVQTNSTSISWSRLNTNTDTKVTQTKDDSGTTAYPLLMAGATDPNGSATTSRYDSNVKLTPSTNTISANISGNAATASSATNDSDGNAINTTYLKLSGGTMTGKLTTHNDQYTDDGTTGGIDMQNSNIVGLNAIYTKDASGDASEGIHFYRDSTHTDTLWMAGGHMYFVPNRALSGSSASTTAANSNKVAILPTSLTNGYLLVTDGTDGNVAISDPATTQVGYSVSSGNATTCNGWKIVVGSLGQSTDTIYFVTT